jgi:hypothetical protein
LHIENNLLMTNIVTLVETDGGAFISLFTKIIDALPDAVNRLSWHIVRLYGEGDMRSAVERDMAEILDVIERDGAFPVSWPALKRMSVAMTQVFELLIVAVAPDTATVPLTPVDNGFDEMTKNYDIVIEAFDNYEWRVGGLDQGSIHAVEARWKRSR